MCIYFYFLRVKKIDLEQFWAEKNDLEHFLKIVLYRRFWAEKTDLEQMQI